QAVPVHRRVVDVPDLPRQRPERQFGDDRPLRQVAEGLVDRRRRRGRLDPLRRRREAANGERLVQDDGGGGGFDEEENGDRRQRQRAAPEPVDESQSVTGEYREKE